VTAPPRLGLICGARAEAASLGRWRDDLRLAWRATGARPGAAAAAAEALLAEGCGALLSFGVAGALAPGLLCGAVLSPARVIDGAGGAWPCDPRLTPQDGAAGDLLGVARVVGDPADKAALRAETSAVALDMESAEVARVATAAGASFGAVRVVSDPAERTLPAAMAAGLGPEGRARPLALLAALAARPGDIGQAAQAAADFGRARRALAAVLDETLGAWTAG